MVGTEQAEFAHLTKDRGIGLLVTEGLQHPRGKAALAVVARRIAHRAFIAGELLIEQQRVVPLEGGSRV